MGQNNQRTKASFGRLIMIFIAVMLAFLCFLSYQTLEKLTHDALKQNNQSLESSLDQVVAHTAQESFAYNRIKQILTSAQNNDFATTDFSSLIAQIEKEFATQITCFFYKDHQLIQSYGDNNNPGVFTDLMKNLHLKGQNFILAQRQTHQQLMKEFGPGNRLELIKGTKNLVGRFNIHGKDQYSYWTTLDNNKAVFVIVKSFPDFIGRFSIYKKNSKKPHIGGGDPDEKKYLAAEPATIDQMLAARIKANLTGKTAINAFGYNWAFVEDESGVFYCRVAKPFFPSSPALITVNWLLYFSAFMFVIFFLLYFLSFMNMFPGNSVCNWLDSISIRYRIMGLFAIASVFPVLFSALIAASSMTQRTEVIRNQVITESIANLRHLENMITDKIESSKKMSQELREVLKTTPATEKLYKKYLEKYGLPEYLGRLEVRDGKANVIFTMDDRQVHGVSQAMDMFSRVALKLHAPARMGKAINIVTPGEIVGESVLSTDEIGMAGLLREPGRQWIFRMGTFPTLWYWDVYSELATGPAFITVTGQLISTYRKQIEETATLENMNMDNILLYSELNYHNCNFKIRPIIPEINLEQLLNAAIVSMRTGKVIFRNTEYKGIPYWLTIKPEKSINSHVFLNMVSRPGKLAALNPLKTQLIIGGAMALLVSLLAALLLTRLFIWPIDDLAKGITAIRERQHDFRIPVRRNDEFGAISSAFNNVIEELKELEYGRIVQTSLLPAKIPVPQGYDLACFRASATDLAGDYHDVLPLDDGKTAIILGDVTGHGISAALAMAMAKATVDFMNYDSREFPTSLMDRLNALFNKELKPRHKFMTLVTMVLDPSSGTLEIDNAGQSFPYYYIASKDAAEEVAIPSMPLGAMKKRRPKPQTRIMKKNDAVILYSDGIIECSAPDGEMFGYDRFYETFVELQRQNLTAEQVLNTMISQLNTFRKPGPYPDDVTLVMLKKN